MTFARHPGDRAQVALGAGGAPSRAVERQRATGRVLQRGPRVRGRLIPHSERKIQYLLFHERGQNRSPPKIECSLYSVKNTLLDTI